MRTPISRRTALRSLAGVAATATLVGVRAADSAKSLPAPTASAGRIRQSVCKWCFRDIPLDKFSADAKAIGLESVELLNPEEFPTLKKYGLHCAMVNAPSGK